MNIKMFHTGPLAVNTYVSNDDTKDGFMVDPGGYTDRIEEYLNEECITLKYIILTHGHCDHIGGVSAFKEKHPGLKVISSAREKEILSDPNLNSSIEFFGYGITVDADIYVNDNDELNVGNTTLKFLSTPGHSPGGMCILAKEDENAVCYSGDTIFKLSVGRTDLYGGDMDTLINSIREKLYALADDIKVLPGHMGMTTIGDEKRYNPFVQHTGK